MSNKLIQDFKRVFADSSSDKVGVAQRVISMTMQDAALGIDSSTSAFKRLAQIDPVMHNFVLGYVGDNGFPAWEKQKEQDEVLEKSVRMELDAPDDAAEGDVWYDRVEGESYVRYSGEWVRIGTSSSPITTAISEYGIYADPDQYRKEDGDDD